MDRFIIKYDFPVDLDLIKSEMETQFIFKAVKEAVGNKTQAAKLLGISFRQLRHRIKKLKMRI